MKPPHRRHNRLKNPLLLKELSTQKDRNRSARNATPTGYRLFRNIPALRNRRFRVTWRGLAIGVGATFGFLVLCVTGVFAYYVRELPNPKTIAERPLAQSTKIVDRNGKLLYNIHGSENRTVVKPDAISPSLKQATVAVEDATFYQHHGFAIKGIARAVLARIHLVKDRTGGGGSTITQQYIKNVLFVESNGVAQDTLSRKIKELILSIEVEQIYSKEEILTGYLNEIPYGGSNRGVEAASQSYFGKSAKDLTVAEAATLAGIPQAPTYYSPYGNHLDDLFDRKNYILDRMAKVGSITQAEADKAKTEAPTLENPSFRKQTDLVAPHFVFYVQEKLINSLNPDPQIAEKMLAENGYYVKTSLDLDTQALAQRVISDMGPATVKKYNATNAALVSVDPKSGEVLAMVGSIDYNTSKSGNTNFADANLQPGSSFKPIVYATGFGPKHTYSPSSVTYDVPTDFGSYKPNNYNGKFNGAVTDRMALDGSLNIPAVKNLALVGVPEAIQTAKSLGISTLTRPASEYGLSLVLGSGEAKPVEMAGAYAGFANGGMFNALRPILTIEADGKMVKDFRTAPATKALEPETAYQINNVLSDNGSRAYVFGLKNNLTLTDRPVAAKSGTTENNRDAWTIGYTPSVATAVWVGNNEANKTMVKGADGSYVAAPIWKKFMEEYLKGKPVEQFSRPSTIKDITVDKLSGKLPTDQSPENEKITDIFAPWQVPTDSDTIHTKVKVVKTTGKLASDLTPTDLVEERSYFTIHSERPNDPNWEQPVQEWAKATYGDRVGAAPTDKDDTYTEDNRPAVTFSTPTNGSVVSGTITIQANPGGIRPITGIDYAINNVQIGHAAAAPWSITYDTGTLPPGSQVLTVTATNDLGLTRTTQISVSTSQDSAAPGNATNPAATPGKTSGAVTPIKLTWVNPSDSDVTSVAIYQSTKAGILGDKVQTVAATPNSAGTASLSPAPGKYYYTLHTIDAKGNENTSAIQTSAIMAQ